MKALLHLLFAAVAVLGILSATAGDYPQLVAADHPVAWWRFDAITNAMVPNSGSLGAAANGELVGNTRLGQTGPRLPEFPDFDANNAAAMFNGTDGFIRIKTSADNPLAFKSGDTITIESWVRPNQIKSGRDLYIIGKGRTRNDGFVENNQNWGLRLHEANKQAHLSFLFRDEKNLSSGHDSWHRWISEKGFHPGEGWHYVVVSYTFGKGSSMRGWLDGEEVSGQWSYGGQTDLGPVVDGDEVWIGSSQGGAKESTFTGLIDEVAVYRKALTTEKIRQRFIHNAQAAPAVVSTPAPVVTEIKNAPEDKVHVQILESGKAAETVDASTSVGADSADDEPPASSGGSWDSLPTQVVDEYDLSAIGFAALPTKYSSKGIKVDRPSPFLARSYTRLKLPTGEYQFLIRAHSASRLVIDGKVIATTPFANVTHADAEEVPDQASKSPEGVRVLLPGHYDELAKFTADGQPHTYMFEVFVGGHNLRPEIGEACVAWFRTNGVFRLLAPQADISLTDEGWEPFAAAQTREMIERDATRRQTVSSEDNKYWARRHEKAASVIAAKPAIAIPTNSGALPENNLIDHFINAKLEQVKVAPAKLLDDESFLRRATLDILGLVPTPEQIAKFQKDKSSDRRAKAIDRLLADPGWADPWVSYWQDVLAENPGMLKPTLNNTGPFRWFLYDSFRDNKPMDRFVTELVEMEGSLYHGGAAGFAMASENDVPMAAKAHIVSKAFLGMELGCARCHDAPYHPFKQEQLFSMAAMLKRAPQKVPLTSSIPTNSSVKIGRLVQVTLPPGSVVKPAWPFTEVVNRTQLDSATLRHSGDTREELAALITDPHNNRFPRVIVNRVWKKYLGWGLVEPVDDWPADPKVSHPELLDWLAREFVSSGYDLKHVTKLILNSQAYQRAAQESSMQAPEVEARLFAGPARRRMTAEQVVDSLFAAVGKPLDAEELNQDADGRRPAKDFNNLGSPKRAWEFCSLANERDRPALALPRSQAIVDTLMMFGWRESRPNPLTVRDDSPNVLQPANLANSTLGVRIVRMSDDSALTKLALENQPLPDLVRAAFVRILSRQPMSDELQTFTAYLEDGYAERVVPNAPPTRKKSIRQAVSWSNHLNAEATKIKLDLEVQAREGDPPTAALKSAWRERMEDMVWAMINSPEYIFVP